MGPSTRASVPNNGLVKASARAAACLRWSLASAAACVERWLMQLVANVCLCTSASKEEVSHEMTHTALFERGGSLRIVVNVDDAFST